MDLLKQRVLWIAIAVLPFQTATGQFFVVSHAPAHGAANVETTTTIELTFNEPINSEAEFEASDISFLGVDLYPYPGDPNSTSFSNDRTVQLEYDLDDDTQYWVLIWAAQSTDGDLLDAPLAFTFTTGTSLPTAIVSGTVSSSDVSLPGTVVGLFPPAAILGDGEGDTLGGLAVVTPTTGSYAINFVAEGDYIPVAIQEMDFDGDPSGEGEGLGAYDPDGDRVIDPISIGEGEDVAGIDMTLLPPVRLTGRELLTEVSTYAESGLPGSELAYTTGINVDSNGKATIWVYGFVTDDASINVATLAGYFFLSPGDLPEADQPTLPDVWIDSDAVLSASEEIGGAEIRAEDPGVVVIASLMMAWDVSNVTFFKNGMTADQPRDVSSPFAIHGRASRDEHLSYDRAGLSRIFVDPGPVWTVLYFSDFNFLMVAVDAVSGEVVGTFGLPTSAHSNLDVAAAAATDWSSDARLVLVSAVGTEGIRPDGRSSIWMFTYYDAAAGDAMVFYVSGGMLIEVGEIFTDAIPSTKPLPDSWISSEDATASAEAVSDGFRSRHVDAYVTAVLAHGQREHGILRPVWRFVYASWDDDSELTVDVEAQSGEVITASETPLQPLHSLQLHPNYPNPFTSSTALRFDLPSAAPVRVAVYDALGREIALLVEGMLGAGSHTVEWRPESLSSGLYLARLTSGGSRLSTVLTLVR